MPEELADYGLLCELCLSVCEYMAAVGILKGTMFIRFQRAGWSVCSNWSTPSDAADNGWSNP